MMVKWELRAISAPISMLTSLNKTEGIMTAEEMNMTILGDKPMWFDRTGLYKAGSIVAKIMLSTREHGGDYIGYKVTIISKSSGVIDGKFFNFNDYEKPIRDAGRLVSPREIRIQKENNSYAWVIPPHTTLNIKKAIFKYINFFN